MVVVSIKSEAIFKCSFFWVEISRNAAQVLWGEENNNAAAANDDDDDDDGWGGSYIFLKGVSLRRRVDFKAEI